MALTVEQGFVDFDGLLKPSGTESSLAASHRSAISDTLRQRFGMTHFFRSGSMGHNTSVRGHSDTDYFAVFPAGKLREDSNSTLQMIREGLLARFPRTEIVVRSPAVVIPFGIHASENHEIVPG